MLHLSQWLRPSQYVASLDALRRSMQPLRIVQESSPETVFAMRLRDAREAAGMSQPQLAERLYQESGIRLDPTAITRMELGKRMIRLNEAVHLSAILGIRLMDLMLLPPWAAGINRRDRQAQMRAIATEIARLDAAVASAQADASQATSRAVTLREQREDLAMTLAMLVNTPSWDDEEPES